MSTTELRPGPRRAAPTRPGRVHVPCPRPAKSPRRLAGELMTAVAVIVALAVVTGYVDLLIVVVSIIVIVMLHELGHFADGQAGRA